MARLYKRRNVYYCDLFINGTRVRRPLSTDKREAQQKLLEMMGARSAERYGHPQKDVTLDAFTVRYLDYSNATKAANTVYRDKLALSLLASKMKITKLRQVTPELLSRMLWDLHNGGMGANHANRIISALKAAMRKAEQWGLIGPLPWRTVKPIKTTRAKISFWSIEELRSILASLKEPYKTIAMIAARTGMRLGEVYHLEPGDVDWERRRINVTAKPGWNPKDFEARFIPAPEDLLKHIKTFKFDMRKRYETSESMGQMMRKMIRRTGHEGTMHKFRHTYASHLVMAGVPIYTVSKLLGHGSVKTTEAHYAHLADSHLDDAVKKLPEVVL